MKDVPFFDIEGCDLAAFEALTERTIALSDLRFAAEVTKRVPVYDVPALGAALADAAERRALLAEWAWVLGQGPGVLVLRSAYRDTAPIDRATAIYDAIIAREKAESGGRGDHFAKAGANDRIWNSLQKLCAADAEVFALYFGNPAIAAVCEAWLGPAYQMTAQVNLVRPGGAAQTAHRDYHLGFQTAEGAARFPAHVHELSPYLTLQGAVAHVDMGVESGPTKLLPFSQLFRAGYMAYHREDFRALFEARHIQMPLAKGDAVFFNPALFHAGGREPDPGRAAHGEPVAGVLRHGAGDGVRRPRKACAGGSTLRSARSARRGGSTTPRPRPPSRRRRRGMRSRRTSIATRRWAGSRPRARRRCSAGRWRPACRTDEFGRELDAQSRRRMA